jgi:hypothetical protein
MSARRPNSFARGLAIAKGAVPNFDMIDGDPLVGYPGAEKPVPTGYFTIPNVACPGP